MESSKVFFTEEETTCYKAWYSIIQNYESSNGDILGNNHNIPKIGVKTALFFKTSGLPIQVLHEIWRIVDSRNQGSLSFCEFGKACRLISLYQNEKIFPTLKMANKIPEKLAYFNIEFFLDKFNINSQIDLKRVIDSYFSDEIFISNTIKVFKQLDVENKGIVDGLEIFNLFINSNISREVLKEIWDCSDIDSDGKLSITEFIIFNTLTEISKKYKVSMINSIPIESIIFLLNNVLRSNYCGMKPNITGARSEFRVDCTKGDDFIRELNLDIDSLENEVSDLTEIQKKVSGLKRMDYELILRLNKKKFMLVTEHKNLLREINEIYNKYIDNRELLSQLWEDIKFLREANCLISSSGIRNFRESCSNRKKRSNEKEIGHLFKNNTSNCPNINFKNWVKFPSKTQKSSS